MTYVIIKDVRERVSVVELDKMKEYPLVLTFSEHGTPVLSNDVTVLESLSQFGSSIDRIYTAYFWSNTDKV